MSNTTQPNRPASTGETATATAKAKRPRTVYKADEIPHRWANAADPFPIKGGNLSTRLADDGTSWLFSYDLPIACRFTRKRKGQKPETVFFLLPSGGEVSSTTRGHLWSANRSIPTPNGGVHRVPVLVGGGVGAVSWSIGGRSLKKPDEHAHRLNLQALIDEAESVGHKAAAARTENLSAAYVRQHYETADAYRAAFLPRLKRVEMPHHFAASIQKRDARAEQLRRIADEKEAAQGRMDWNLLRPEVERIMRERAARDFPALHAAALAEVIALAERQNDWTAWQEGGAAPRFLDIPDRWELQSIHFPHYQERREKMQAETPALFEYLTTAPINSAYAEAMRHLIDKGTFKRPVRYAWGHEVRQSYPEKTLKALCAEAFPDAMQSPENLSQEIYSSRRGRPTLLRVGADGRVETTHGARVPLAIVKRAWDRFGPIVARAAAGALSDEDGPILAAALPFGLDPYTLTAIDSDGVRVGCHNIPPAEVVRFAASQGWTAGVPA